jgi:hypothetical protein
MAAIVVQDKPEELPKAVTQEVALAPDIPPLMCLEGPQGIGVIESGYGCINIGRGI